jgi:excisionase family DNA binding protein
VTEPWVTLAEVATHLQVAEETIHRWIRGKCMPAHRAGRNWRFKLSQVDAWMQSGGAAPGSGSDDDSSTGKP